MTQTQLVDSVKDRVSIFTHISARVPDTPDQFPTNPCGRLAEITASSLVKVNEGQPVLETPYDVNPVGPAAAHLAESMFGLTGQTVRFNHEAISSTCFREGPSRFVRSSKSIGAS